MNDPLFLSGTTPTERYRFESVVSITSGAVVYAAVQRGTARKVAVKVFRGLDRADALQRDAIMQRLAHEASVLEVLRERDRSLCEALGFGVIEDDNRWLPYVAFEWIEPAHPARLVAFAVATVRGDGATTSADLRALAKLLFEDRAPRSNEQLTLRIPRAVTLPSRDVSVTAKIPATERDPQIDAYVRSTVPITPSSARAVVPPPSYRESKWLMAMMPSTIAPTTPPPPPRSSGALPSAPPPVQVVAMPDRIAPRGQVAPRKRTAAMILVMSALVTIGSAYAWARGNGLAAGDETVETANP